MGIDNNFISSIKDRANIVDIIGEYVNLKSNGTNYKACCPFHNEKTPSFMVSESKQIFKCFGCGKSGDVIQFVEFIERVDFVEAVKLLAGKLNMEIPDDNYNKAENNNIAILKEINTVAARHYYKKLISNSLILEYLKKRGISPEMIKVFGLGFSDSSGELLNILKKDYNEKQLVDSGLFVIKNNKLYSRFWNRVMFPIFDVRNKVIAFGGRQLEDYGPKYLNSPETAIFLKKENLYAFNIARKNVINDSMFLVEGYMDVIKMHQFGYKNTVASLGTALTADQVKLIKKSASKAFIIYDSDEAGIAASLRALDIAKNENLDCRVVTIKGAKDPDEFLSNYGPQAFEKLLLNSDDYLIFNLKFIKKRYDLNQDTAKMEFLKESTDYIKKYLEDRNTSHIYVENAIYYLADITGYSVKSIGQDIFGKYFSTKQFKRNLKDEDVQLSSPNEANEMVLNLDEFELDKREKLILSCIIMGKIKLDEFSINDFIFKENRLIYAKLLMKQSSDLEFLKDYFRDINSEELALLKKNMKKRKFERQIEYFESIQLKLLQQTDEYSLNLAIIIGQHIINLNNNKNKY